MVQSKEDLWRQLLGFEKRAEEEFRDKMRKEAPERKKRFRRTADEIEKAFVCQAEKCQRSYGSEGSLFQHIKLKHPEIYAKMSRAEQERHLGLPADPESNP